MKQPIQRKLFLSFILFGVILISLATIVELRLSENSILKVAIDNAKSLYIKDREIIQLSLEDIENKLIAVENSKLFHFYLKKEKEYHQHVEEL
ncbi:MAG: hypothetical protein GXO11_01635, partial [Epsilonproteobacteria bacterium]|nr:hypothetical protein [Campylobacterota bacterium]